MEYFVSHLGIIICASLFVAFCAVLWWYLMDKNARLKRQRAQARIAEARLRKDAIAKEEAKMIPLESSEDDK